MPLSSIGPAARVAIADFFFFFFFFFQACVFEKQIARDPWPIPS